LQQSCSSGAFLAHRSIAPPRLHFAPAQGAEGIACMVAEFRSSGSGDSESAPSTAHAWQTLVERRLRSWPIRAQHQSCHGKFARAGNRDSCVLQSFSRVPRGTVADAASRAALADDDVGSENESSALCGADCFGGFAAVDDSSSSGTRRSFSTCATPMGRSALDRAWEYPLSLADKRERLMLVFERERHLAGEQLHRGHDARNRLRDEVDRMHRRCRYLRESRRALGEELSKVREEVQVLQALPQKLAALREETAWLMSLPKDVEILRAENSALRAQTQKLEALLGETGRLHETQHELATLRQAHTFLLKDMDAMRDECSHLHELLAMLESERAEIRALRALELATSREVKSSSIRAVEAKLTDARAEITMLREENAHMCALSKEVEALREENMRDKQGAIDAAARPRCLVCAHCSARTMDASATPRPLLAMATPRMRGPLMSSLASCTSQGRQADGSSSPPVAHVRPQQPLPVQLQVRAGQRPHVAPAPPPASAAAVVGVTPRALTMRGTVAAVSWAEVSGVPWLSFTSRVSGMRSVYGEHSGPAAHAEEGSINLRRGEFVIAISGVVGVDLSPAHLAACLHLVTSEAQEAVIGNQLLSFDTLESAEPNNGAADGGVRFASSSLGDQRRSFDFRASPGHEIVGVQLDSDGHIVGVTQLVLGPSRVDHRPHLPAGASVAAPSTEASHAPLEQRAPSAGGAATATEIGRSAIARLREALSWGDTTPSSVMESWMDMSCVRPHSARRSMSGAGV